MDQEKRVEALKALGAKRKASEDETAMLSKESKKEALRALRDGIKPATVARSLQYTDGYIRKLARDADLPPDPRYAGLTPPRRNIGLGSVGIGDTAEEAIANAGPIDYGGDLRAIVTESNRQRIAQLMNELRREHADWYRSKQAVVSAGSGDMAVELLVHALAEGLLEAADFES